MECVQPAVCRGPAEPENAVCPEAALPEGGGGAALPLPGEHTHPSASLQQPRLPPRVDLRALVSGNCKSWVLFPTENDSNKDTSSVSASQGALSCAHTFLRATLSSCEGIVITVFGDSLETCSLGMPRSQKVECGGHAGWTSSTARQHSSVRGLAHGTGD